MKNNFLNKIEELKTKDIGISIRKLNISNTEIYILYLKNVTDREGISNNIIKPILKYKRDKKLTIDLIFQSIVYIDEITLDNNEDNIIDYILKGNSIILIPKENKYIVANTKKIEKRGIQIPELENALKAPKDSFNENFDTNLSLIRYRIKDSSLKVDTLSLGKRTKTSTALIYIKDIVNPKHVNEIKNKLMKINIDGVLESGYLQKFLQNNPYDLFPQTGLTERSDKACGAILDGKICIIVEGSNLALIIPKVFFEFLDSADDHYGSIYLGMFSKGIRILGLFISLSLSALYVAVISYHSDILPAEYVLILAEARAAVPFNAFIEASLMELVAEILREASIRLPRQIGPAIGIVGTIVIGQAAVSAGLVSTLMVIIVSLSTMCSFVSPDYTLMNPIRILKFFLILCTGTLGLFGFTMGMTVIFINILSVESFGVSYFAPITPFNSKDIKNYILSDPVLMKKRAKYLKNKDNTRK